MQQLDEFSEVLGDDDFEGVFESLASDVAKLEKEVRQKIALLWRIRALLEGEDEE